MKNPLAYRLSGLVMPVGGLLLLAACAVGQPVAIEEPRPSDEEKRRAVEQEQRRARDKAERRAIENVMVLRAGEAFGGEIPDLAVVHLLYATDRRATGKDDPPHSTSKCNTCGLEDFRWCFESEAFPRPVIEPALNR